VALSDEAAIDLGVTVGGHLAVQLAKGAPRNYTVATVYANDALPGDYLLPASATVDFGVSQPVRGFVRLDDGAPVDQVLPQVNALLADSPEVSAADRGTFIAEQTGALDTVVISLFGALLGVVVGAGLGAAVVLALDGEGITDLVLPWRQMTTYLLLASVVGVAAAVLPAIRAARLDILHSIGHH
jgi:putative ABC transport system permease protein